MKYSTIFFDLDGTLYPRDNGIWEAISARMNRYMIEVIGIPAEEVQELREMYFTQFGTTLKGLAANYNVQREAYLAYVHDIPLENYLDEDLALQATLRALPQKKWILTNSDRNHARRVAALLGVADLFDGVIDVLAMNGDNKPQVSVYRQALKTAGEEAAGACVFLDDVANNLAPAKELGFFTVLVGAQQPHPAAELSILKAADLIAAMPQLVE
jgi:putative hydrolase of the HAD superfamily